jgi:hypothetical protein
MQMTPESPLQKQQNPPPKEPSAPTTVTASYILTGDQNGNPINIIAAVIPIHQIHPNNSFLLNNVFPALIKPLVQIAH